jgi:hypothetical protein
MESVLPTVFKSVVDNVVFPTARLPGLGFEEFWEWCKRVFSFQWLGADDEEVESEDIG